MKPAVRSAQRSSEAPAQLRDSSPRLSARVQQRARQRSAWVRACQLVEMIAWLLAQTQRSCLRLAPHSWARIAGSCSRSMLSVPPAARRPQLCGTVWQTQVLLVLMTASPETMTSTDGGMAVARQHKWQQQGPRQPAALWAGQTQWQVCNRL